MTYHEFSEYDPLGPAIAGSALTPDQEGISSYFSGQHITLVPLDVAAHTRDLYLNVSQAFHAHASLWRYFWWGPFPDMEAFARYVRDIPTGHMPYVMLSPNGRHLSNQQPEHKNGTATAVGHIHLERISEKDRCIEMGTIMLSPTAQRTPVLTETVYLLLKHCFEDLGYLRVEWKCNALNGPSRNAALRIGFLFEAIFAKHMIIKGKGRDTAWYRMLDEDWWKGGVKEALETWLQTENFDDDGRQITKLRDVRKKIRERDGLEEI